jgi:hypothetical protein
MSPRAQQPEQPSTSMVVAPELMAQLMQEQVDAIQTRQPLPKVRATREGRFTFSDSDNAPREFTGIIVASHLQHTLWMPNAPTGDPPRCSSRDGKEATPIEGYRHPMLNGGEATGTELLECARCPLLRWGSKRLIDPELDAKVRSAETFNATLQPGQPKQPPPLGAKARACNVTRHLGVVVPTHAVPIELVLSPTNGPAFDRYLTQLTAQRIAVAQMLTRFTLTVEQGEVGGQSWGVVNFTAGDQISQEQFLEAMKLREQFAELLKPSQRAWLEAVGASTQRVPEAVDVSPVVDVEDDEALPF